MFRIDHATATVGNLFTEGNPSGGVPATVVTADWLNDAVQEELANLVEGASITLDKLNNGQVLEAVQVLVGTGSGFGNAIINGDFQVYQRDNSESVAAGTPEYVMDRWLANAGGGSGAATITRLLFAAGQVLVPGNPRIYMEHDQTVAATTTNPSEEQRIEDVGRFQGGKVTAQVWAKVDSGSISVTPRFTQDFGVGGSADVDTDGASMSITSTWTKFSITVTLPSISGKTVNAGNFLGLKFLLPTGVTFKFHLAQVQLVAGESAPAFQQRPLAVESALCYRYYEKSYPHDSWNNPTAFRKGIATGWGALTVAWGLSTRFRVEKYQSPTVVWYDPEVAGAGNIRWDGAQVAVSSQLYDDTSATGGPTVASQAESLYYAHWEADAEL